MPQHQKCVRAHCLTRNVTGQVPATDSDYAGKPVTQPSCFIAGERDPVRRFIPGIDLYNMAGAASSDFRGSMIVPRVGHWVQQEAPDAATQSLGLDGGSRRACRVLSFGGRL